MPQAIKHMMGTSAFRNSNQGVLVPHTKKVLLVHLLADMGVSVPPIPTVLSVKQNIMILAIMELLRMVLRAKEIICGPVPARLLPLVLLSPRTPVVLQIAEQASHVMMLVLLTILTAWEDIVHLAITSLLKIPLIVMPK